MKLFDVMASVVKLLLPFLLIFEGSAQAIACGYHVATPQFLNAPHPTTYVIAVALRKAADEKRLTLIEPQQNAKGYHSAVGKLEAFTQRLNRTMQDSDPEDSSPGLSIVLVDVSLWSRIVIKNGILKLQPHVEGAGSNDVVISTAESVLAAMLHGDLSFQEAMTRGLIHIEGTGIKVENVKQMIASSIRATSRISSLSAPSQVEQALKQNAFIAVLPGNK